MAFGRLPEHKYQHPSSDLVEFLYNHSIDILETAGYGIRYHEKNGIGTFEIHRQLLRDPITNEPFSELQDSEEESLKVENYGFDQIFQDVLTKDEQISLLNKDKNIASINLPSNHLPSSYSYDIFNISKNPFERCRSVPNDLITLNIPYSYAQFGHDMVLGDFNGDGIQDLGDLSYFFLSKIIFIDHHYLNGFFFIQLLVHHFIQVNRKYHKLVQYL
jgi:hypothetical protein